MALKVLFAAAECAPLVRVGGLADVIGSLPKALKKLGVETAVVLPGYKGLEGHKTLPGSDIPLLLVKNEEYFGASSEPYPAGRDKVPRQSGTRFPATGGGSYWETSDDPKRFGYFSRRLVQRLPDWSASGGFKPDVIHVHDWHTAFVPAIAKKLGASYATVLTIHNLAMQGISPGDGFFPAGLSEYDLQTLEWDFQDENVDLLLQGILNADVISTLSPTYAGEILTPEFGEGLHEILKAREARLFGILNGVDYEVYDPSRDECVYQNFDLENFEEGKAANKKALQEELGFEAREEVMLVGFIGPLIDQNGLSLIIEGFEEVMALPLQFVILGVGDRRYERQFCELFPPHVGKFSAQIKDDKVLAQKIYAGCDLLLVPSRFEPCGTSQMIAMRYGTLPLVRAMGSLADSVVDGQDGFVFEKYEARHMLSALRRAVKTFCTPTWRKMVEAAMQKDFSWEKSAKEYIKLYEKALGYAKMGKHSPTRRVGNSNNE